MLFAVVFSVSTGVGGCWWPIYVRAVLIDVAFRKFSNNPPNSDSVADATTFLIMLHSTCTGPFSGGISCIGVLDFGPRKISTGSALCLWLLYLGCIQMYADNHSASSVFCYCICMCRAVILQ